ncbi:hypothetical protein BV25DRAFT_1828030 [Artomyces pyxidatus]|uniref:Uncharacterized protein n=1 Tax=Artomyces pyxidatus TaxID=48021 RepID=A0ACB8SVK4_9AGAM|nr:hypothetical protein BV25DRAFT_1828030 [Artomyces pyxidatus]
MQSQPKTNTVDAVPDSKSNVKLLERMFPDSVLGFSIDSALISGLEDLGAFVSADAETFPPQYQCQGIRETTTAGGRPTCPRAQMEERMDFGKVYQRNKDKGSLMAWLNHFNRAIQYVLENLNRRPRKILRRGWLVAQCNTPIRGAVHVEPEVLAVALSAIDSKTLHRSQVDSFANLITASGFCTIYKAISAKISPMFAAPDARHFILGSNFTSQGFSFWMHDLSGLFHYKFGFGNKHALVRLIAGFAYADDEALGHDTTLVRECHSASLKFLPQLQDDRSKKRVRSRLPLGPVQVVAPIETFRSTTELISGFSDITEAHKQLHNVGILHSDVAPHNLGFANEQYDLQIGLNDTFPDEDEVAPHTGEAKFVVVQSPHQPGRPRDSRAAPPSRIPVLIERLLPLSRRRRLPRFLLLTPHHSEQKISVRFASCDRLQRRQSI